MKVAIKWIACFALKDWIFSVSVSNRSPNIVHFENIERVVFIVLLNFLIKSAKMIYCYEGGGGGGGVKRRGLSRCKIFCDFFSLTQIFELF